VNNQMTPIGKLFNIEKGELQSTKCTPGDYDFITAAEDWKTHNEYTHECEALIFAAAASGSLGRTHYVDGKFTTSDLCYILTPKDEAKYPLNLSFYHFVFNSLRPTLVAATKSGTSKESINQTNFKNYKIPYFDIELQDFWIEKLKNTLGLKDLLGSELTHQQILLKKLRQQILQEAIEGKLTADWRAQNPDVEPASELLKRIAVEKAQLVKDKKIKAQKPLPPITDEEQPFELPQGWEWCRLGDLGVIQGGGTPSKSTQEFWGGDMPWICPKDMKKKYLNASIFQITSEAVKKSSAKLIDKRSVLFVVRGMILSHTFPVSISTGAVTVNQDMKALTPHIGGIEEFIALALRGSSPAILKRVRTSTHGTCRLEGDVYFSWPVALPSFQEQQTIVTKVEKLLALCDQLETQITQNQAHAEQLMQTVLREAFSHNSTAVPTTKKGKASAHTPEDTSA